VPLRGLLRGLGEAWEVPRDLALRRYPPFVSGGPLARGEVPVFVFHGAEQAGFARKVGHLADNGYVTLSTDEYLAALRGQREPPERAVLLTFDDGRGSVWSVAAPLLRRHGMRATVFLVPGRMRSRPLLGPTLDDPATPPEALARQRGELALMSWEEVEALAATGLFDFQSHSLRHARVHTSPRLAGFATPASRQGYDAFDQPVVREGEADLLGEEVPLGTPLLASAPRLAEELRFLEDPAVRSACVALVRDAGGADFYERPGWRGELERAFSRTPVRGRTESREEQVAELRRELAGARDRIQERTGRPVVHLCYPWHAAGPTARVLAAQAGYETAFGGKVPGVPTTLPGGDLANIARVSEDYVELLPGRGRETLAAVLRRKWLRRFGPVR
jgi:peptidoglycan/xylan/chitin deacetylase (PgdA/CDA1 family)